MLRLPSLVFNKRSLHISNLRKLSTPAQNKVTSNINPKQEKKRQYGNGLFTATVTLLLLEAALYYCIYEMEQDPNFATVIEKYTNATVVEGLNEVRGLAKSYGLLKEKQVIKSDKYESLLVDFKVDEILSATESSQIEDNTDNMDSQESIIPQAAVENTLESESEVKDLKEVTIEAEDIKTAPIEVIAVDEKPVVQNELTVSPAIEVKPSSSSNSDYLLPQVPSEIDAKSLLTNSSDSVIHELTLQSVALRREFEANFLKDLNDLDDKTLKFRYAQLAAEFFERNKWEGIRIQQALKQLETEVTAKYIELMKQQRNELEHLSSELLKKKEESLTLSFNKQIEEQKIKLDNEFAELIAKEKVSHESILRNEIQNNTTKIQTEAQDELNLQLALLKGQYLKKYVSIHDNVEELYQRLTAFEKIVDDTVSLKNQTVNTNKLSAVILAIEYGLKNSSPIGQYLATLSAIETNNISTKLLVETLTKALPSKVVEVGALTLPELKLRYAVARNEVRKAALSPEGVPTIIGQVIGNALASVSWAPKGYVSGDGIEETLARAEFLLNQGKIKESLNELENIKGYAGSLLVDWKELANHRLIADLAANILRAEATLNHASL